MLHTGCARTPLAQVEVPEGFAPGDELEVWISDEEPEEPEGPESPQHQETAEQQQTEEFLELEHSAKVPDEEYGYASEPLLPESPAHTAPPTTGSVLQPAPGPEPAAPEPEPAAPEPEPAAPEPFVPAAPEPFVPAAPEPFVPSIHDGAAGGGAGHSAITHEHLVAMADSMGLEDVDGVDAKLLDSMVAAKAAHAAAPQVPTASASITPPASPAKDRGTVAQESSTPPVPGYSHCVSYTTPVRSLRRSTRMRCRS